MKHTKVKKDEIFPIIQSANGIYFLGIGGVSMSGLAHMALLEGKRVWGSDRQGNPLTEKLVEEGAHIIPEDFPLPFSCDLVVHTHGAPLTHPILQQARNRGTPILTRSEYLGGIMAPYPTRITISGTHGKSTTLGMLSYILEGAALHPTVAGGAPLALGKEAWLMGDKDIFLAEGCEYKGAFLDLSPTLALVTNLEHDHPDCYPTLSSVQQAFSRFLSQSKRVILGGDSPYLMEIAPPDALTYGFSSHCHLRGILEGAQMQVWEGEYLLGTLSLSLFGAYNYQNALGAVCVGRQLGIPFAEMKEALATFPGIGRRMEWKGRYHNAEIYLDYAHHPTEMMAAITALKERGKRVHLIFQPHTYTRTYILWKAFINALKLADSATLIEIYGARESPMEGVTSYALAQEAGVNYAPSMKEAVEKILPLLDAQGVLVLMGAGDIPQALQFIPMQ